MESGDVDVVDYRLLVRVVGVWMNAEGGQGALAYPTRSADWARLLNLAHKHKVTPLVAAALCGPLAAACPPEVVEALRSEARVLASGSLASAQTLREVVRLLRSSSIDVVAYKGPLLAALAYKQLGLREFGDLDVLVQPWDYYHRVGRTLAAALWKQVSDFGFERSYLREDGKAVLDVHRAITDPRFLPLRLDFATIVQRVVELDLMGTPVKTFAPAELLVVLCVQLAKDTGEVRRGPPLIKVCDIAQLVRSHPELDWDAIIREARRLGVLHIVCLGMAVAANLLGCGVPEEVQRLGKDVPELDSLVRHVEERIFADEGRRYSRPELLDPLTWNAAIRERFRDRNRTIIALREAVLAPNERDYAFVRLPRNLDPLYRLVKPVRLAWKSGRRLVGKS